MAQALTRKELAYNHVAHALESSTKLQTEESWEFLSYSSFISLYFLEIFSFTGIP